MFRKLNTQCLKSRAQKSKNTRLEKLRPNRVCTVAKLLEERE